MGTCENCKHGNECTSKSYWEYGYCTTDFEPKEVSAYFVYNNGNYEAAFPTLEEAQNAINAYKQIDRNFGDTRSYKIEVGTIDENELEFV